MTSRDEAHDIGGRAEDLAVSANLFPPVIGLIGIGILACAVWGPAHAADTQYLRVYIGQLRQKIEIDPGEPHVIITEPGIGYRIAEATGQ